MPASRGRVSKLYYNHGFLRQRMQLLQDEFAKNGQEGPFAKWLENWDPEIDIHAGRVTTRVPCADYFHQRDDALRAHATQIDPDGFFFATPMEWQQRLWPTEEFELARSRVPCRPARRRPVRRNRDLRVIDLLTTAVSVLADEPPKNTGPDFGKASPLGLLVVVLLLIGTFVLVWSMNRHLKKLPKTFDDEPAEAETVEGGAADGETEPAGDSEAEADTGRSPSEPSG